MPSFSPSNIQPDCTRCPSLCGKSRKHIVWGEGNESSAIVGVGEAPGKEENFRGRPFCGTAGDELTNAFQQIGLSRRDDMFITNILKCRPPNNRDPKPEEISNCEMFLKLQLSHIQPSFIITFGRIPTQYFLGNVKMEMVHGLPYRITTPVKSIVIPCYHPAAGLYNSEMLLKFWDDIQAVKDVINGNAKRPVDHIHAPIYRRISIDDLRSASPYKISIDTESYIDGRTQSIQVSWNPGVAYYIDAADPIACNILGDIVSNPEATTVLHYASHDLPILRELGIYPAKVRDTMTQAYLLQRHPQGLKPLSYRLCGMEMKSYEEVTRDATRSKVKTALQEIEKRIYPPPPPILEWKKGKPHRRQPWPLHRVVKGILRDLKKNPDLDLMDRWKKIPDVTRAMTDIPVLPADLSEVNESDAIYYAGRDADATLRCDSHLYQQIHDNDLTDTLETDSEAIDIAIDMMEWGMKIDPSHFGVLSRDFKEKMRIATKEFAQLAGFNCFLRSDDEVRKAIKRLGITMSKKTKKSRKDKVDDRALSMVRDKHPAIRKIQDFRKFSKLKSTYADALPRYADDDNRIHCTQNLTRVATGRLSTSKPSLMNIPVRTEEGNRIRKGFICDDGNILTSGDYSQIELRVLADQSQDANMLKVFSSNGDIHAYTAMEAFGVPESRLDSMKHRYPAKRFNFGIAYDISDESLLEEFILAGVEGWDLKRVSEFRSTWFEIYSGAAKYMKEQHAFARRYGYVKDLFGRRRWIGGIRSKNRRIQAEALRQAGNTPIQSGAAHIMKRAMVLIKREYRELWRKGITNIHPLIQIHDDLMFEVGEKMKGMWINIQAKCMESAGSVLCIPTPTDFKTGYNWGTMEKYKR